MVAGVNINSEPIIEVTRASESKDNRRPDRIELGALFSLFFVSISG